jgi:hypothetical protein
MQPTAVERRRTMGYAGGGVRARWGEGAATFEAEVLTVR